MPVRSVSLLVAGCLCVTSAGCGSGGSAGGGSAAGSTAASAAVPAGLEQADAALRRALRDWRAQEPALRGSPPAAVLTAAARERGLVHQLSKQRPAQVKRVLAALPGPLHRAIGADVAAARALRRLSGPSTGSHTLHLVAPAPAGDLLADYRVAQRRFGVHWQVLAAVNLIESAFGRVVNHSSAGAQGPMQFLPATWRAYGLGGDVHVPRDAIMGAANYLHQSGAPADTPGALYAYNRSHLYVAAVRAYADQMRRDPLAFLAYYAWEASLPATIVT